MTNVASILDSRPFILGGGGHDDLEDGACFNELAAVLAGEPFSASPKCVSPIIGRMGMSLNDRLDDKRRQLLRPFVLRSLGTANDGREEERRQMCNEWLLHNVLPDLLEHAGKKAVAKRLRALPADLTLEAAQKAIYEARDEAWDARKKARAKLAKKIGAELEKRGAADAVAVAVAVAVADAAALPAVAAVAVAAADAVAVADLKSGESRYLAVRRAVREKVEAKLREIWQPKGDELLASALDLMDRMCPPDPLLAPVIDLELARVVCAAPEKTPA